MQIISGAAARRARLAAIAIVLAASAGCGIEKQSAPALTGPSELGMSIVLTATPDIVPRDGASQSTIVATVRGPEGSAMQGVALALGMNPSEGGTLSHGTVISGPDGRATFIYTAPPLNAPVTGVVIGATPVGTNFDNAVTRVVSIALAGPAAATPSFTVAPAAPRQFELTVLDASATTLEGAACGASCTYTWRIGSEATLSGQVVTHRFRQQQVYSVMLEVTSPGGMVTQTQRSVTVGTPLLPVPSFTVSPTNPLVGQTVFLNASASTVPNGATIVEYHWDFGNGTTGTGQTASTSYGVDGNFVVTLTIRDSNGLVGIATQNVTVREP